MLFESLAPGTTIITPNNRLSNQLLRDYFKQQNVTCQVKPRCLPYQAFLRDAFKRACHQHSTETIPLLLTSQQQAHVWRQILEGCNENLLHEVQEAWSRCEHWLIDPNHTAFSHTPQTQQFQTWQYQFQQQLDTLGAITEAQLVPYLLRIESEITSFSWLTDTHIIWACFDDYTPQQKQLQQAFDDQGYQQSHYDLPSHGTSAYQFAAKDTHEEWHYLVNWLQSRLDLGEQRIAVVVPELQSQSQALQRYLQRNLPHHQFDISLGKPLTDYPLIAHALHWLKLEQKNIDHHTLCLLLQSPFLAHSKTEFSARVQAMQDQNLMQEAILPSATVLNRLNQKTPKLAQLLDQLSTYPDAASPADWVTHFKTRLINLGFPGEYTLNSQSYQCFQRFNALFDDYLQLTPIAPTLHKTQALDALRALAHATIFQAQTTSAPIQILGVLEASGCTFDSVWVTGLTDQSLPQKTKLSAFIPPQLQRDFQMPRATPARELQLAKQTLQRLQNGCRTCVFSYPRLVGDTPHLPSPLISALAFLPINRPLVIPPRLSPLVLQTESYCYPLSPTERASGGTTLLANQAKCPFRAFAAHRLHAIAPPSLNVGPNGLERGQIIHRIMDALWTQLDNQQQLNALSSHELNQRLEDIIQRTLNPLQEERPLSFMPLVYDVETARLKRLVTACLDWEKARPAFSIAATEQSYTLNLAGLDFKVRIDRLDQLDAQQQAVIDYKTSIPINKPWNEERPEAPQLLMYALLNDTINALLFVELKAGRITCSGLSEDILPIKGVSTLKKGETWENQRDHWRQQLTSLAQEFRDGHCPPQPTRTSTCQRCEFQSLCRITN